MYLHSPGKTEMENLKGVLTMESCAPTLQVK